MPAGGRTRTRADQSVNRRTRAAIWVALMIATCCSATFATSTVWESVMPQWMQEVLDQRARFLTLCAAIFGILAIVVPGQIMPRAYLITVIAGGLTGYAAVINSFDPMTLGIGVGILIVTVPVFILSISAWRWPRRWEWAGWPAIASLVIMVAVIAAANTPLGAFMIATFGNDIAFGIWAGGLFVGLLVFFVSLSAFVVKAVGMALSGATRSLISSQASGQHRSRRNRRSRD